MKIFDIGYAAFCSMEHLRTRLDDMSIDVLVDVRTYRSSKIAWVRSVEKIEGYVWIPELGGKQNLDWEERKHEEEYRAAFKKLLQMVKSGKRVAVMCCEKDRNKCHRYMLIGKCMEACGIEVVAIEG